MALLNQVIQREGEAGEIYTISQKQFDVLLMLLIKIAMLDISGTNSYTGIVLFQTKLHRVFRATGNKEQKPVWKHRKTVHYKVKEILAVLILRLIQSVNNDQLSLVTQSRVALTKRLL